MSDIQSQLQEIVPRAAIYKGTNKSIDSTVHKVEYVTYPSNLSHVLEVGSGSSEQKVHFHISGNCLLDGKNSYFSVQLKTNKWTSCLSGDITSLFKRVTISLPSSGNQILEDIQEYNVLSSMVQYLSASAEDLDSNWYSGQSSMFGNTREENMERSSPRFELECGHRRLANLHFRFESERIVATFLVSSSVSSQRHQSGADHELCSRSSPLGPSERERLGEYTRSSQSSLTLV